MAYLWLKAAHVASVLIFIGGLFAQCLATSNLWDGTGPLHSLIERWDRRVTTPAMFATWMFGVLLAVEGAFVTSGWLLAKLAFVVLLSGLHGVQAGRLRRSLRDRSATVRPTYPFGPAIVSGSVIAIVILVVTKPT